MNQPTTRAALSRTWSGRAELYSWLVMGAWVFALVVIMQWAAIANAQDSQTLKFAGVLPPTHFVSTEAEKVWMDKVTDASHGKIKFEYYPAQQLGRAQAIMSLVVAGTADIGAQAPGYVGNKLPLAGIIALPGLPETSCRATAAFSAMLKPGGLVYENDLKPNQVRALFTAVYPQYRVITAKQRITTISDFSGLKLRTDGGVMESTVARLGAISVQMSAMDTYQSLARGTIDGLLFAYQSLRPSKIETIAKYALTNVGFGSAGIIWMISDATWQKLPEDVRGIMLQAGEETERSFCAFMDKNEASEAEALRAGGMTFTTMDETDLTKVTASFAITDQEWASKLDSRDKPGSAVLAAFKVAASPAHQ